MVDLPLPDSPTRPNRSPGFKAKETPSTAFTGPAGVVVVDAQPLDAQDLGLRHREAFLVLITLSPSSAAGCADGRARSAFRQTQGEPVASPIRGGFAWHRIPHGVIDRPWERAMIAATIPSGLDAAIGQRRPNGTGQRPSQPPRRSDDGGAPDRTRGNDALAARCRQGRGIARHCSPRRSQRAAAQEVPRFPATGR